MTVFPLPRGSSDGHVVNRLIDGFRISSTPLQVVHPYYSSSSIEAIFGNLRLGWISGTSMKTVYFGENCNYDWDEQSNARTSMNNFGKHQLDSMSSQTSLLYSQVLVQIADAIPQLVWISNGDGLTEYFNQKFFTYTGKTYDELKGYGWQSILHPLDLQRCDQRWRRAVTEGQSYEIEYRLRRGSDGTFRWHLGRAHPVLNESGQVLQWFGTCTDIDDQKQAQIMLQSVMDNISQSIFWKDKNSVFLGCNRLFAKNAGYSNPSEVIGKTDYDFENVPKEQADFFRECDKYVMEKNAPEYNIIEPFCTGDGKTIWLSTSKIPLHDNNGDVVGILGMFSDVTDREKLILQREDFMASLAHDLKVPIVGAMKVLEAVLHGTTGPVSPEQTELFTMLQNSNSNLLQMVNNLLQVLKYEAETDELYFMSFELVDLLQECVKEVVPIAEVKKVKIEVTLPDNAPIEGDRLALRRVVFNLLSNALDFSSAGTRVALRLSAEESGSYVLTVTNQGEPINPEDLQRLFQRFWQGQRFGVGTGLGLYLARQVVEGHGGEISCSSDRSVGTTIRAVLPKKAVAAEVKSTPKTTRSRLSLSP